MDDPLDDARAKVLCVIERLERVCLGLQDVNAGVSPQVIEELHRLRAGVLGIDTGSKLEAAWNRIFEILKLVAPSLIKLWIETLSCFFTAAFSRRWINDGWRELKNVATRGRPASAGARTGDWRLRFNAFAY